MRNNNFKQEYLRRAKTVAFWLQLTPFVRMVGLNGSLARGEAKKSSDIDFFIVLKKDRIWLGRMGVTLMTQLSGYRRHGHKIAGMICLNRYQTDDFLTIWPHNEYHARDYCGLIPLVDIDNTYAQYFKKNVWTKKFGCPMKENRDQIVSSNWILTGLRHFQEKIWGGRFGDGWEKMAKKYQKRRILRDKRTMTAPVGKIRVSDQELCFHPPKGVDKLVR